MLQSHVIEIDGSFVGAAVRQAGGYRFVAVDCRLDEMDGGVWPSLADIQRVARRVALSNRFGATGVDNRHAAAIRQVPAMTA